MRPLDLSDDQPHHQPRPAGHSWLLAIGIDRYEDEQIPNLYNAVKDVEDFVALLRERYGFGSEKNATVITLYNEDATRDAILDALESLSDKVGVNDHVILYFSGHGDLKEQLSGYWIPGDAPKNRRSRYISNGTVKEYLDAIKSHHTFLIVDSCFSGTMFAGPVRDVANHRDEHPSRWGLTSGRNEVVSDGKPGQNSPFAKVLLKELSRNNEPLGVMSLCNKVMEIVETNEHQTPRGEPIRVNGHDGGQYFFRPTDTDTPDTAAYKKVTESRDIRQIELFLVDHDTSPHKTEVRKLLKTLRIEAAWAQALHQNTIDAYDEFIEEYPESSYAAEARQRKRALADAQWQRTAMQKAERIAKQQQEEEARKRKAEEEFRKQREAQKAAQRLEEQKRALEIERRNTANADAHRLDPFHDNMVLIKGGTFRMGNNDYDNEKPVHPVAISDFYIAKHPVTQGQWKAIMNGENPSQFTGDDNLPVDQVSWGDVQEFTKKLNALTKQVYRLPTEAEWEYAARGGKESRDYTYAGSNYLDEVGWYWEISGDQRLSGEWKLEKINKNNGRTHPVMQKMPNELGLYDMSGNVWEWCQDWYESYPAVQINPKGSKKEDYRVVRGGSWFNSSEDCRSTIRNGRFPDSRNNLLGFRLARYL